MFNDDHAALAKQIARACLDFMVGILMISTSCRHFFPVVRESETGPGRESGPSASWSYGCRRLKVKRACSQAGQRSAGGDKSTIEPNW